MKVLKTCLSIFILTLVFTVPVKAQETSVYEEKLNALIENGVISQNEAQQQLVQLKSAHQNNFHKQVRGVASKIKDSKIYEIVNEPLEIPAE